MSLLLLVAIWTVVSVVFWWPIGGLWDRATTEPVLKSELTNFVLVLGLIILIFPGLVLAMPGILGIHLVGADPQEFPDKETPEGQLVFAALPLIGIPLLVVG